MTDNTKALKDRAAFAVQELSDLDWSENPEYVELLKVIGDYIALTAPAEPVGYISAASIKKLHEGKTGTVQPRHHEHRVALYTSPPTDAARIVFEVETWQTWFGADYFVMAKCGDQKMTLYSSRLRYQMEYHRAELDWFVNGGEKPDLMAFSEESHPNLYPNEHPADKEPKVDKSARIAELEADKRELLDALEPVSRLELWDYGAPDDAAVVMSAKTIKAMRAIHAKLKAATDSNGTAEVAPTPTNMAR